MITFEELTFLRESNNIENVWDDLSLQQAVLAWQYLKRYKKLTIEVILETHRILMLHHPLLPHEKGSFRKTDVWVGGRMGAHPASIPYAIEEWCRIVNKDITESNINSAKSSHILYEKIHPFIDGNGRTGRMFMNWTQIKLKEPLIIIENEKKQVYYQWFK